MFRSPLNRLIISIDNKYVSHLQNAIRRANINPGTQINPANYVTVIGKVESVPLEIVNQRGYWGYSLKDIQVGDTAIFRYDVVWNFIEHKEQGTAEFRNLIFYNGKQFWKADILQIFAVIRNDSIKMVNGFIMVEHMAPKSPIVMLRQNKKDTVATSAILTQIGNNLTTLKRIDAFPGDTIYYNPNILQEYEIKGKKIGFLRQSDVLGKKIGSYGDGTGTVSHIFEN